ncbi:MAG TPA: PDZ domain-containing protein [Chthoniobacteraceae bacterium]
MNSNTPNTALHRTAPGVIDSPENNPLKTTFLGVIAANALLFHSIGICQEQQSNKEIQLNPVEPGGSPPTVISNLSGIGAVINKINGKCVITTIVPESGSAAAGLQVSDVISHIDGRPISALELLDIAKLLRGEPDSRVTLTITRKESPGPADIQVRRKPVVLR